MAPGNELNTEFNLNKQYQEIAEHNFGTLLNVKNNTTRDELDYCLKRDIIRAIAIAFQGNNNGKLGPSTDCKIRIPTCDTATT